MQTSTSSSTAESETVAASYTLRRESLPIQTLFLEITVRVLPVVHRIDNTQAIRAIEVGYSKKLRYLPRTHRVSVGFLNECCKNEELRLTIKYCPTTDMKADLFTKALDATKFDAAMNMVRLVNRRHA